MPKVLGRAAFSGRPIGQVKTAPSSGLKTIR